MSNIIRASFKTVAERFDLNKTNCPKHPSNCTDEWIKSDFQRGILYFLLELDEKNIGCAALEKASSELCYLKRLAVIPEKRNMGFGKMLIDHVFNQAELLGCKNVSIGIIAKQQELKSWYSKKESPNAFIESYKDCVKCDESFWKSRSAFKSCIDCPKDRRGCYRRMRRRDNEYSRTDFLQRRLYRCFWFMRPAFGERINRQLYD